ncbi:hypothetical protein B6E66_32465 [Streptomyces maremycinicus]|nr:hypothetical protein B6E66_32465 [Streptomyces sp. B9173]
MDRPERRPGRSRPYRPVDELVDTLAVVHAIPGTHFGRLAGSARHHTWRDYLHDRLSLYTATAPALVTVAAALRQDLDRIDLDIEPRLLHHDLQPEHLLSVPGGPRPLLDWELAAFGDPLSDLARLAVRLRLLSLEPVLTHGLTPANQQRLHLYWRLHLLADAALATDPGVRAHALALTTGTST